MPEFKPEDHLLNLPRQVKDGDKYRTVNDQYLEVKWRLVWFRDKFPNGTVETEEVCVDLDREVEVEATRWVPNPAQPGKNKKETYIKKARGYARYKAIVTNGEGGKATGTKTETAVDFPDFCEKAETGAIGRALAVLGIGTQFVGQELSEKHRIVDAPVKDDGTNEAEPATNQPASKQPTKTTSNQETATAQENKIPTAFELRLRAEGLPVRNSAGDVLSWSDILAHVFKKPIAGGLFTLEMLTGAGDNLTAEYCKRLDQFLTNYEKKIAQEQELVKT